VSVENALCQLMEDNTSLSALVSDKIYPMYVPHGVALPAVTYQQIGGGENYVTSGRNGQQQAAFQVNCWGTTPTEARTIASIVQDIVCAWKGTYESVTIQGIFMQSKWDIPDMEPKVDMINAYGKAIDLEIHYHEDPVVSDGDYSFGLYGAGLYNNV